MESGKNYRFVVMGKGEVSIYVAHTRMWREVNGRAEGVILEDLMQREREEISKHNFDHAYLMDDNGVIAKRYPELLLK